MDFDSRFEEEILAQSLKDVSYLNKASRLLDAHHFISPEHAWVWKKLKDFWRSYKEKATPTLMLARARADFPKEEERVPYIELLSKLYKKKITAPKATLVELNEFVRIVNAQLSMEEAAKHLEKGRADDVYKVLARTVKNDIRPREYTRIQWIENFEQRQEERRYRREHLDEFTFIPTGFRKLDTIMSGGIQLGELGLILGTTGKGKSITMTNVAFGAVKKGYKAVYFALEMPARQIAMRQDALWLGMPYKKFKEYDFTAAELRGIDTRLKKVKDKWGGLFEIISMPLRKCDINTITSTLEDLSQEGFKPDLVLIDSADHMKGIGRFESYRLQQAEVYWDLKSLAEEGGYAVWSTVQAGKEWAKKIATAEGTSESYDKARIADVVFSLNKPELETRSTKVYIDESGEEAEVEEDKSAFVKGDYMEIFLAKYRDGSSKMTIPVDADFSRMHIGEIE